MKKSIFIISLSFLIVSCGQNFNTLQYNQQSKKYKICLKDANRNIETKLISIKIEMKCFKLMIQ